MSTPEFTSLPIREFLEGNGDRISEAVRRAARFGAGGHEPIGVEAEVLMEQASSAIIEALSAAIDSPGGTLHLGVAGDVTVVAEIVPEGPRTRSKVLLRAGRTLPVASLPVPSQDQPWNHLPQQARDAAFALEQGGGGLAMDVTIADSNGEVRFRGATPEEEYAVARTPHGELVLVPLSLAMNRRPLTAQGPQAAVYDDAGDEFAAYVARWRSHIDEMEDRIASHLEGDEAGPDERDLLVGKIENALARALADALSRRNEAGLSYGIESDIVIAIPRPLTENSIMVRAARLVCQGAWIPGLSERAGAAKRRRSGRK